MRRVVPSVVVALIDRKFPRAYGNPTEKIMVTSTPDRVALQHILDVAKEIPDECLGPKWVTFDEFVRRMEAVFADPDMNEGRRRIPSEDQRPGSRSMLSAFRELLSSLPDEVPSPATHELRFILDASHRETLRTDISSVNVALSNGEWKAATVLAGSVVEALLLWALEEKKTEPERAVAVTALHNTPVSHLQRAQQFPSTLPARVEKWEFWQMILVAAKLGLITESTSQQANLCREFRNLIHPAKANRQGPCDRGTALSAVAAIEHVVKDLS
jgi:hypothetical protein